MVRNLDAFKNAKEINEMLNTNEQNALKKVLIALMEEMDKFVQDAIDISDTFYAVKSVDEQYAEKLWKYLFSKDDQIEINSHWGFKASSKGNMYYHRICVNRKGLAIFYNEKNEHTQDWGTVKWQGNNAKEYVKHTEMSIKLLEDYIYTSKQFIKYFPLYRDEFFRMVSQPKF